MIEHPTEVASAVEALAPDLLKEFPVTLMATTRMHMHITVNAYDMDHAAQIVGELDFYSAAGEYDAYWSLAEDSIEIEGDEAAFVDADEDNEMIDEREVDCRQEGEPFSWKAVEIVKKLARMKPRRVNPKVLRTLVMEARRACSKL